MVGAGADGGGGQPRRGPSPAGQSHNLAASLSHVETTEAKAHRTGRRGSDWNQNFDLKKGEIWQAAPESGYKLRRLRPRRPIRREWRKGKFALYRETLRTTGR